MLAPASTPRPTTIDELLGPALMAKLDRLDLLSRKVFAGKLPGERRSKRRGQSVEFDDYRDYVPGDDLRHIDWNVFARLDRFFVKLFREDEDLALHLVIDASSSMDAGTPSKLAFAQSLAMALGYIGLVNQNRVAASIVGVKGRPLVQRLAPMRGRRSIQRLAEFLLQNVEPLSDAAPPAGTDESPFNRALKTIALARTGKGVMVVLSDFLVADDWREGLNYLAGGGAGAGSGGFDTYCLQVLSPGEIDPARETGIVGDLRLVDAETGRPAEITISAPLLKRYKQRLEAHIEKLRSACAARSMAHALVRSDADLPSLLMNYLRRRGLVG